MKFSTVLFFMLIINSGCEPKPHSLTKDTPVDEEMTIPDFFWLQTNESKANSLKGKVIQLEGYLKNFRLVHEQADKHLGIYRADLAVNISFTASVDCFFLDSLSQIDPYQTMKIKGVMFKEGAFIGLKYCAVMK